MARPLRILYPGAYYHVFCRGNKRQKIFLDDYDRRKFLEILRESLKINSVVLYFYVMMDNHFHLGVQTLKANLSDFMRRFNISYTGWFNFHHTTCGHLYQGRYKAILVDADKYFLELSRYIHLNPIRKNLLKNYKGTIINIESYFWSSLPGYITKSRRLDYINYHMILDMVGGSRKYMDFLLDGIKNGANDPFKEVRYQTILGDEIFVNNVRNLYLKVGSVAEQPNYRDINATRVDPATITDIVIKIMGVGREAVNKRNGNAILRGLVSDLLYRYSNMTQKEIGSCLGLNHTAVSKLRSRLKQKMTINKNLVEIYNLIVREIHRQLSNVKT